MLTKDNVTIGIEWRFGPDWPGQRCGAKTRRGTACQRPANKKNGRCRLHGGACTGPRTEVGPAQLHSRNRRNRTCLIILINKYIYIPTGISEGALQVLGKCLMVAGARNCRYCRLNYAEIQRSFENNQTDSLKVLATYFQGLSPAVSQGQERRNNSSRQI